MMRRLTSLYRPSYVTVLVYMLQGSEYRMRDYLRWYWRTLDFSRVMYRRNLASTKAARLLQIALGVGMAIEVVMGLIFVAAALFGDYDSGLWFGLALLIGYPIVWAHLVVVPLLLGRIFIVWPRDYRTIKKAQQIFADHSAVKIAVAGSYGKTSMKEILLSVLSEGKKTAATPANKNVRSSHALFASKLKGDEEVLIVEYGEGAPGDIKRFVKLSQPNMGVITGLAPAHLDRYKSLDNAATDILYLASYLKKKPLYVNGESAALRPYVTKKMTSYTSKGIAGWKAKDVKIKPDGLSFRLQKGKITLNLKSGLIGKHQLGPLSVAVAIANEIGLSPKQIETGVAKTKAFEHRMQPRKLHGAWIIDDTYNGNIEGIQAGLAFLKAVDAKRKIYVTPGLVDQGREKAAVHRGLGRAVVDAQPDILVLMHNSTTEYILEGLGNKFRGELFIQHDPLEFYNNLDVFVAAGDVVLMQNDWTDNYA